VLKKIEINVKIKGAIAMSKSKANVLGYIELETGSKLITPMNNVFLNYTFNIQENWEDLREIVNIFYHAYIETFGDTKIRPTEGEIKVKTQFPQYRDLSSKSEGLLPRSPLRTVRDSFPSYGSSIL